MNRSNTVRGLCLLLLFFLLSLAVWAGVTAGLEARIAQLAARSAAPPLTALMQAITRLGDTSTVVGLCLLLCLLPRTRRLGLSLSAAAFLSSEICGALKRFFARPRPDEALWLVPVGGYSFPSGHASLSAAIWLLLLLLLLPHLRGRRARILACVLLGLIPALVGLSRIYLSVHWAGDVLGGWLLGGAVALLVASAEKSR